ncbi:MAG TPA: hypothetical protein PKV72_04510 [Candidatus Peribacteria bacterium]|nr:hypothetical protein [Candidatus Peribacteria bacterium]
MQVLVLLIVVAVIATALRHRWIAIVRPLWSKTLLITYAVLILLCVCGGMLWYWWTLPSDEFYGVKWEGITVEEGTAAIERLNTFTGTATSSGMMGMGGSVAVSSSAAPAAVPATPTAAPVAELPTILETLTGSDVLPSVPFWKHVGIAPEVVIPSQSIKQEAANDRQIEVSIVGSKQTLVLPSDYLSRTPDGQLLVTLDPPRNFKAGKYTLEVRSAAAGGLLSQSKLLFVQDFTWGVLAFNPDSDVYAPGETAKLQVGVLDDDGVTLCNASVTIRVAAPSGSEELLSTANSKIRRNPDCRDKAVTDIPDYAGETTFSERGTYVFTISADTPNGQRTMTERISVVGRALPDIKRLAVTRIYPLAEYTMRMSFTPSHSFEGAVAEHVPSSFKIRNPVPAATVAPQGEDTLAITWTQRWEAGRTYQLEYTYDAPDISPEFYLLGPITIDGDIIEESVVQQ